MRIVAAALLVLALAGCAAPAQPFASQTVTAPNVAQAVNTTGMEQSGIELPGDGTVTITWMDQQADPATAKAEGAKMADKVAAVLLANPAVKSVRFVVKPGDTALYEVTKTR